MRLAVGLVLCCICGPLPALAGDKPQDLTDAEKRLLSAGYHVHLEHGQKVFCRREVQLGSHFEKKVCGTAEQLAAIRQTSRDALEDNQRHGTNPTNHIGH